VEIVSGQTAKVDIDTKVGDIEVTLRFTASEPAVQFGYGIIISLDIPAFNEPKILTVHEARQIMAAASSSLVLKEGVMLDARSITFDQVVPGPYTACVSPFRADPRDPTAMQEFQKNQVEQKIICIPARVESAPAKQEIVVDVEPLL